MNFGKPSSRNKLKSEQNSQEIVIGEIKEQEAGVEAPLSTSQKIRRVVEWGLMFLLPAMSFYLMEWYEHNPFEEVRPMAQWFNILLLELIAWILFFLIGKARAALRIELLLAMIFGLVNHYVMEFRSTPFVPWDIFSVGTAASVAGEYDFTPTKEVVIVTLIFVGILILLQFMKLKLSGKRIKWLIPAGGCVLALCILVNNLQDEDFQTSHSLYPFLFTPVYMTQVNGMAVTFTMNLQYIMVDKPQGYDADDAQALLAAYEEISGENAGTAETGGITGTVGTETEELPNIIVIMDEAFSDLGVLEELATNVDYMPFVHSLQQGEENTVTGTLHVSVCGGNTANSEFEFLTGNTMAFLPNGSIPYQQYIKGECSSIVSHLNELGYVTYAMHPYYASGWNRDEVYEWMGFSESIFLGDMISPSYLRKYVSDAYDFEMIQEIYEGKPQDQPLFLFNVTMQNHGSYGDSYENFTPDVTVEGNDSFVLSQYLSLVKETDEQLEDLISYFSEQEEKTVVVFFGDHQPADVVANQVRRVGADELETRYQVPYVIWANYDIEEGSGVDTSLNYLAAEAFERCGIPTSSYQDFLLELKETYPVISAVAQDFEEEESILNYKRLQYYEIFDWKEQ